MELCLPSNRLLALQKSRLARIRINARRRILKCDPRPPRRDELVKLLQFSAAKQSTTKSTIISSINFKK